MKLPHLLGMSALALGAATAACDPAQEPDDTGGEASEVQEGDGPSLCAAVRGNGHYIVTHFASLARIVEHYGVVDGIAGGSSGSVTAFVYESIRKNPAIARCGDARCSPEQLAARVSLALKSVEGYGQVVASSEEAVAIGDLAGIAARLRREVEERGVEALEATDVAAAAAKLEEVLAIPEVRALVNPEITAMLEAARASGDAAQLAFAVGEVKTSVVTLGAFSVDDNRLFFRPGALDWNALATLFGRVADFYAGYAPADPAALGAWLDACAAPAAGKPWDEASELPYASADGATTCGAAFAGLVSTYREAARASGAEPRRLGERIDAPSPVRKLVSTSVLEGDAVHAYETARAAYLSGAHPTGDVPFDVSFDDVKFGYWGAERDTRAVLALGDATGSGPRFSDVKTRKATSLGAGTWREILTASPAEPGLSRFVTLPDGRLSAGGWSDLAPTVVLRAMGCDRVVYVTREGDESEFATRIAKHLGMSAAEWRAIYDLADPASSFNVSLEAADAVWCTSWNAFESLQQREMAADAWSAPLEVREGFEDTPPLVPYPNTTPRTGKVGCTPGLSGGATYPN